MINIAISVKLALALAVVVSASASAIQPGTVQAQEPKAERLFATTLVASGEEVRVFIYASNYGPFGQVVETLPEGFQFLQAQIEDNAIERDGQTVRFTVLGVWSFSYVVRAPKRGGDYTRSQG